MCVCASVRLPATNSEYLLKASSPKEGVVGEQQFETLLTKAGHRRKRKTKRQGHYGVAVSFTRANIDFKRIPLGEEERADSCRLRVT